MTNDTALPFDESKTDKSKPSKKPSPGTKAMTTVIKSANTPLPPQMEIKQLLAVRIKTLNNYLGDNQRAMRFMTACMHAVEKVPKLLECTPKSVVAAFMECAALELFPGSAAGDCYILPFWDKHSKTFKAQFCIGYRGIKTLAYRSGILACGTNIVYKNDKFKEILGTSPRIEHLPTTGERGEPIAAYAWAKPTQTETVFKTMSKDEIMKIKAKSPAKDQDFSPWNSNDPMLWMWQKTAFKQLGKLLPTSERLSHALYLDNVAERGGFINDTGEIIEASFIEDEDEKIEDAKIKKANMRNKKN